MRLSLSGGGYRAALFQLGVVRYLRETDRLKDVKEIYSVSGGSILAGHLVKNWDAYAFGSEKSFEQCAKQLVDFMMKDLRTKVVSLWLFLLVGRIAIMCAVLSQVLFWWGLSPASTVAAILVAAVLWRFWLRQTLRYLCILISLAVVVWNPSLASGVTVALFAVIFWKMWPRRALIDLLIKEYDVFFGSSTLNSISKNESHSSSETIPPHLYVLTTDLTTGKPAYFDLSGLTLDINEDQNTFIRHESIPLSVAVAASSAFPPLFSPVRIDSDYLKCPTHLLETARYLTDGGVYDNLGLEMIMHNQKHKPEMEIISCNAERLFDYEIAQQYGFIVARTIRSNDIMMSYMSSARESLHKKVRAIRLKDNVTSENNNSFLTPELQRVAGNLRTDLDDFTKAEVQILFYKGYGTARASLDNRTDSVSNIIRGTNGFPLSATSPKWLPCILQDNEAQTNVDSIGQGSRSDYFKLNRLMRCTVALVVISILLSLPVFAWIVSGWGMLNSLPKNVTFETVLALNYEASDHAWISGYYGDVITDSSCSNYVAQSRILGWYTAGTGHSKFLLTVTDVEKDSYDLKNLRAYLIVDDGAGIPLDVDARLGNWMIDVPAGKNTDKIVILLGISNNGPPAATMKNNPFSTTTGEVLR